MLLLIILTLQPSSVKKRDFRTGGSVKHNFPYWSEIPNWFRTTQNWSEPFKLFRKHVQIWFRTGETKTCRDQKRVVKKNRTGDFGVFVLLVV